MEYTEDQLSGKFPMSQKPWEDGLYEVTHKDGAVFYSYFINGDWLAGNARAELASQQSPLVTKSTERDRESWRGLSSDPSAPKKRAGNKRKTMYFVIDTGWGYPHACFVDVENAREYAEYSDRPVRIIKQRFRTPEA